METVPLILVHSALPNQRKSRTQSDSSLCPAAYFFFGGILMLLGAIGEWIVGNTFPFVVFGTFGKLPPHIPSLHPEEQHGQSIPPLPFRRLLAHLRRHPRTLIQRIRRLRDRTRTNGWAEWKSGKSGRVTDAGVQCQLCLFSSLHGCVRFH